MGKVGSPGQIFTKFNICVFFLKSVIDKKVLEPQLQGLRYWQIRIKYILYK